MKRILIVDDEELVRWGLSKTIYNLGDFDKEIKTVDNGRDAVAEIDSGRYDLCFLDIHIPEGNGLDLMKRVKQVSPGTRVVMMTSHDLDEAEGKEIEENAYRFIPKPFNMLQIKEIVESALGRRDYTEPVSEPIILIPTVLPSDILPSEPVS